MLNCYLKSTDQAVIPIRPLLADQLSDWLSGQNERVGGWLASTHFSAKPGSLCLIPGEDGRLSEVLLGVEKRDAFWAFGDLPNQLPKGVYRLEENFFESRDQYFRALMAWGLGAYRFSVYHEQSVSGAKLLLPSSSDIAYLQDWVETIYHLRHWINTPAEDMGPAELANIVMEVGEAFSASTSFIIGEDLLEAGYPAIYSVGRASNRPSYFIDLQWGDLDAPKVTLVGKGVCFDSGGLNIKTASGMLLMKKDMAGAAHALGLARMIMLQKLPVRLRLLIPAVENAVGSQSFRPGDVLNTRGGLTVEVVNTDAEGRLVLCDAIAEAVTEMPDHLIDFATLTGSARIALGPEIPAFFTNDDRLATGLISASKREQDLLWRLPLHEPYSDYLKSEVADVRNASTVGDAGAITAALYLQRFVPKEIPWVHFDMSAWNFKSRPGRPIGAEVMALRAIFAYLKERYS